MLSMALTLGFRLRKENIYNILLLQTDRHPVNGVIHELDQWNVMCLVTTLTGKMSLTFPA
jgi:hypothetical protein